MTYEIIPRHDFFVGIDSDGCVFDTMELKHKECFIPNIVNVYGLQGVSKYARECAEFVNLYSKSRGVNRFPALIETLEWLKRRPEVIARGVDIKIPAAVVQWVNEETKLGNPALEARAAATNDPELATCLRWSQAVNETVARFVHDVPPFPFVRESLERLQTLADLLVISATPNAALRNEWDEHDLTKYVVDICGQEAGTKKESMTNAAKYPGNQSLMIGDALGDYKAAVANDALFYPINPGAEEASWERFYSEGIDRLLEGTFAGEYQQQLLDEFNEYLPTRPPWPVVE